MKATHTLMLLGVAAALVACDAPSPTDPVTLSGGDSGIVFPPAEEPDPDVEPGDPVEPGPSEEPPATREPPSCGAETLTLDVRPPDVMLVLDKSGSMMTTWDHDRDGATAEVTRWSSLHGVVENLVTDFDDALHLGAVLFPAADVPDVSGAEACRMATGPDAPASAAGGASLLAALPSADATAIYGGTPASEGLRIATDHLVSIADGRPQAIVLITDGAANCGDGLTGAERFTVYDAEVPFVAADAFATGVPVYVVGIDIEDDLLEIPVANPWERLSEVADAGGVPREGGVPFYDVFDEGELDDALSTIASDVGCTLTLPEALDDLSRLELAIDGVAVPAVDSCDGGEGWMLDGEDVRLCAASCEAAQSDAEVDARLSCIPEG
ncbi:MAG: vWA domain-containing protein [Myxococcota bacterium]